ncbi:MAG: hypothetical protein FWD55_04240, partial [Propionibacteriaceae bacterium]|nr:hypothetical protein [Propionibacteriaceae bacterium]
SRIRSALSFRAAMRRSMSVSWEEPGLMEPLASKVSFGLLQLPQHRLNGAKGLIQIVLGVRRHKIDSMRT